MFDVFTDKEPEQNEDVVEEVSLQPINEECLSPKGFIRALDERREKIKSSRFVAPTLGDSHFGYFEVEYKQPIFKPVQQP